MVVDICTSGVIALGAGVIAAAIFGLWFWKLPLEVEKDAGGGNGWTPEWRKR